MKKLATAIAAVSVLALATPVFACPHEDNKAEKSADKADKDKNKTEATATAKKSDKSKKDTEAKTADAGKASK